MLIDNKRPRVPQTAEQINFLQVGKHWFTPRSRWLEARRFLAGFWKRTAVTLGFSKLDH